MRDDLRAALRSLRRAPLVATLVVGMLGVGIGALTTLFSFVDGIALRPPPYHEPGRLIALADDAGRTWSFSGMRPELLAAVRARTTAFDGVTAVREGQGNVVVDGVAERAAVARVTPDAFALLRVRPLLGRALTGDDARAGAARAALVSHDLWQRRLGGRSDVLGQVLEVEGERVEVAGVMPPHFRFPQRAHVWLPLDLAAAALDGDEVDVVARLGDGVSLAQARAQLATLSVALTAASPAGRDTVRLAARDEMMWRQGVPAPLLWLFMAAATCVLLVACANVANLLLARNVARRQEMAVRAALGASAGRLLRLSLAESGLLIAGATALGVLLAVIGLPALTAIVPADGRPGWVRFAIDGRALAFTIGIAALTVLAFALPVARQASRPALRAALGAGAGGLVRQRTRKARALVGTQVALAFLLVACAALALQSARRVQGVSSGLDDRPVLTFSVGLDAQRYPDYAARARFHDALVERLGAAPGATAAAWSGYFDGWWTPRADATDSLARPAGGGVVGDRAPAERFRPHTLELEVVTPAYFEVVGLRARAGRLLGAEDRRGAPLVTVVSERLARALWPEGDAVGRRLRVGDEGTQWATVVGTVPDTRAVYSDIRRGMYEVTKPTAYFPAAQAGTINHRLLVRTAGDPLALVAPAAAALRATDPLQPMLRAETLHEELSSHDRTQAWLGTVFSALAAVTLVLALVGLYGVIAYDVAQRVPEIGVRMALGASGRDVAREVSGGTLRLVAKGVLAGALLTLTVGQLLRVMLLSVRPTDPPTLAGVAVILLGVAAAVSWLPARRATRVDPASALRAE